MTADHARKAAIRALMAEKNISYTAAAEQLAAAPQTPYATLVRSPWQGGWILRLAEAGTDEPLAVDCPANRKPDQAAADAALVAAGWNRAEEWDAGHWPYRALEDGQRVDILRADSVAAARAKMEATWRPNSADQPCRCSGNCRHGQQCLEPDCFRRLVHVDRYPGSMLAVTAWQDAYECHIDNTSGDVWHQFDLTVTLPGIPWGEQTTIPFGQETTTSTTVYPGVRHPSFRETPSADDDDNGEDYDEFANRFSYCVECGADERYQCNCDEDYGQEYDERDWSYA